MQYLGGGLLHHIEHWLQAQGCFEMGALEHHLKDDHGPWDSEV